MAWLARTSRRVRNAARETAVLPNKRRTLPRWAAFEMMRGLTPVAAVDCEGLRYFVSTRDRSLGRVVYLTGSYEPEMIDMAVRLLREVTGVADPLRDRRVVDVGANIGTSIIPLVNGHGAAGGIAVEPEPENFRLLQINLLTNGLADRVHAVHAAASNISGTADLELSPSNFGDHRIRASELAVLTADNDAYGESRRPTISVPVRPLDEILTVEGIDLGQVGLLWVDTQGHEGQVLAGATRLLKHGVPACIEFWPYGLRRSDGLELLTASVAEHFSSAIDLRATLEERRRVQIAATDLSALVDRYPAESYTDLLLLPH
jgi:FkbM family methyltransferase